MGYTPNHSYLKNIKELYAEKKSFMQTRIRGLEEYIAYNGVRTVVSKLDVLGRVGVEGEPTIGESHEARPI